MKKYLFLAIVAISFLFYVGVLDLGNVLYFLEEGIGGFAIYEIPEETGRMNVYFCPRDDCVAAFVNVTLDAEEVYCAFYELELEAFKQINYPVISDNDYPTTIPAIYDTSSGLMHNKFCVINQSIVWTGSMNPTERGAHQNNNNVLIIESSSLATNYLDEYFELADGRFAEGDEVKYPEILFNGYEMRNAFCPEDDCDALVLEELSKAEESIYFMTFAFTSVPVADVLIAKSESGVEIQGVMETRNAAHPYAQFNRMNEYFVVKKDTNPATMHHKVFIIDNKTVITGSWNPTAAASSKNDENILVINDPDIVGEFVEEFLLVWAGQV